MGHREPRTESENQGWGLQWALKEEWDFFESREQRGLMKQRLWTGEAIFNDLINYHYIVTMIGSGNGAGTEGNVQERWV